MSDASRSFALGVCAGMRSMMPMAALALSHDDAAPDAARRRWPVLRSRAGRTLLVVAGCLELVGDKLPATPSRLMVPALLGRIVLGGIAGAAVADGGRPGRPGATVIGALGAVAGAFGGYAARRRLGEATGLPDPAIAVAEDLAAIALARGATAR